MLSVHWKKKNKTIERSTKNKNILPLSLFVCQSTTTTNEKQKHKKTDNNRIADIYFRALVRIQSLEHLSIENNGQSLNDNIFMSEPSTGGAKSSVKYLFLSGNALKHREILVRLWALGLTQLEKLHLDNNAFEYIDFYPIDAFPKLEEINLGKNFWKCEWLEQTLQKLEADGIDVNLFSSRFPSSTSYKHINFIPCVWDNSVYL